MTVDELIDLLLDPKRMAEIYRMMEALSASPKIGAKRAGALLCWAVISARHRVFCEAVRSAYEEALRTLNDVLLWEGGGASPTVGIS